MGPDCAAALAILDPLDQESPGDEEIRRALGLVYEMLSTQFGEQLRFTEAVAAGAKWIDLVGPFSTYWGPEYGRLLRMVGNLREADLYTHKSLQHAQQAETTGRFDLSRLRTPPFPSVYFLATWTATGMWTSMT